MGSRGHARRRIGAALGLAALAVALGIAACGGSDGPAPADTVFRGAYVYTVDGRDSVQQAIAVKDGVIVYVGNDDGVTGHVGSRTKVVKLGGRMVMPGFVDGHLHPLAGGRALLLCDLKYQPLSRADLAAAIQACLDASTDKEPDTWLEVVNWVRQATQAIDADPTKATLDALNTNRPIAVRSSDFHTVLANSRALALAGVTSATPDPAGGVFVRGTSGEPTGICEDAAGFLVTGTIPPDTDEDRLLHGRAALAAMRAQGVTTFMDAAAGPEQGRTFTALQQSGELTARAFLAVPLAADAAASSPAQAVADAKALAASFDQGDGGAAPNLRFRHVKIFADGVVNAPADTGALLEPYRVNTGTDTAPNWVPGFNRGNLYFPAEVMNPLMAEIARAGLDVHVHATGERAVRTALDAVAHARGQVPGADLRPAISHNETVDPADYARYQALDVTASFSFQWAQRAPYSVGETENHLGPQRFARMEPFGSLHNAGARVAYGSDWPIDPFDEMLALKIGVTRAGDPESPNGFGPDFAGRINDDPALSRAAALRAITMNSAHQLHVEGRIGSLEVGKYADLIVLENNFMQMPEEELARNRVLLTMVGGKVVHALDPYAGLLPADVQAAAARTRIRNLRAFVGHTAVHKH
jgi:hypothetical protein